MKALQYRAFGDAPTVVEVPRPTPGPGQVLLAVTAAGVCHSDLHIMSASPSEYRYKPLPLTLGHEAAGIVVSTGAGADHFAPGTAVLVYGPWGCGICASCSRGEENYCTDARGVQPPGIAVDGAMAEYLLVDAERHLVPLGDLDPVQAVALTDAGLTAFHAIKRSMHHLGAGTHAVVIGAGGLGHVAVQILRAMTAATVIAVDVASDKLELARAVGAHHCVVNGDAAADELGRVTAGAGADAVFDFVGSEQTVRLAGEVAATYADIAVVGVGHGALPVGYRRQAFEVSVRSTFWGSRSELWEVIALARAGRVRVTVETHTLDEAPSAYERLARGEVLGRAVVVPRETTAQT
ncbi:NAD(P)-dependent alcohol dehydrogenase [Gordonia terrae]|uniref:alcohol dehydrogenase n=2 Tax=Gordonia TaxID=2053 RepID=A0A2I1R404_9ACTN|nr:MULTISPECIES: NAD(P)-dependent alcohol dehydrogenase [Gordonia]PKZ63838.1 NAD(P)-dependent alcohol dehydrogenase [Gordonia terrae]UPW10067.1 NAD(P)-dependent alcohol dehydrogenase [Gordonia terrae]SDU79376.1 alcohol dehydrogenase, propanol-preferring [Gordonia westfalica]